MNPGGRVFGALCGAIVFTACTQTVGTGPRAQVRCPIPADARPWTISVNNRDTPTDSAVLRRVAYGIAEAWGADERDKPDPARTAAYRELLKHLPPAKAFALGKWIPTTGDTATGLLVYRRGQLPEFDVLSQGVRREMRAWMEGAVARAITTARSPLAIGTRMPLELPDSLVVLEVRFGWNPPPAAGKAVFGLNESPVRQQRNSVALEYPEHLRQVHQEGEVELMYIVRADGRADVETALITRSGDPGFLREVRESLKGARYTPATQNCEAIAQIVTQPFNFRLTR